MAPAAASSSPRAARTSATPAGPRRVATSAAGRRARSPSRCTPQRAERDDDVARRRQTGERQRRQEAQLGAGEHHLAAVAVQRGEPRDGGAGADSHPCDEPDPFGPRREGTGETAFAAREVTVPVASR